MGGRVGGWVGGWWWWGLFAMVNLEERRKRKCERNRDSLLSFVDGVSLNAWLATNIWIPTIDLKVNDIL